MVTSFVVLGSNDANLSYDPASDRLSTVADGTIYLTRPTGTNAPVVIPTAVFTPRLFYAAGALWGNGRTRRIF